MKISAKLLVLILFTNFIRDGTSTAHFKCLSGYKVTKDNEKLVKEFSEIMCDSPTHDACYSAKGSFTIDGNTCELLIFFYKKNNFRSI